LKESFNKEKVGLTDIAHELKVSVSTVSRALNNHPRISKKTKEKVRQVATRLGYFPGIPELMTPDRTDAVAVVVPSVDSCVYREIVAGIEKVMGEKGYQTFLIDLKGEEAQEATFFKTFRNYGLSGIIHLNSNRLLSEGFYKGIQKDSIPLVTIFDSEHNSKVNRVVPDMFQGVTKIANHLKANGIKKVTIILEDKNNAFDYHLVSSFEMVFDGLEFSDNRLQTVYLGKRDEQFAKDAADLIAANRNGGALLVKGMDHALELAMLAQKNGVHIPEDMMLIGVGADCVPRSLTAGIAILKVPAREMGQEAAGLLLSRLQGEDVSVNTVVTPVSFILKQSAIRIKK
jgi:LacI family transcriptional regulator